MAKHTHLITAAAVAVAAGLFSAGSLIAQNNAMQGNNLQNTAEAAQMGAEALALPPGITQKQLNDKAAIEKAFQTQTNDAIDKTGFDNVVSNLVDQDRDRIKKSLGSGRSLGNVTGDKNKQLTDVIADIQSTWQSKYNHKFDLNAKNAYTGNFIQIMTGEVSDPNQLLNQWPLQAGRTAIPEAARFNQGDLQEDQKSSGGDVNLEKGRNVAVARIAGLSESGPLTASLISEAGGWKFDVPNTLTADELYKNLTNNLSFIDQQKNSWPSDENEAYRHVTDAVVASLYNVSLTGPNGTANNR